ncbi:cingulin-like protein 1 isoform X2 [Pseudophryne corroboree]
MLHRDQEHVKGLIQEAEASHSKEKHQAVEEIVQLKKLKELNDRHLSKKEMEIIHSKQELEREVVNLTNSDQRVHALQIQLKQRLEQQKEMENQLSQKRIELLKLNSARHEIEEKLIKHASSTQNQLTFDLRNEISFLHQQLREKDLLSEQERVLRQKMMTDCGELTSENNALHAQLLELTKQLEIQRALKEENYTHSSTSVAQLYSVKEREEQLSKEVKWQQELLQQQKEHFNDLMLQIDSLLKGNNLQDLHSTTLSSQIAELQAILAKEEQSNTELRRDKTLLVDHVSNLQNQIANKENELLHISLRIEALDKRVSAVKSEQSLHRSLQPVRWNEISNLADSMKKLSRSLTDPSF